MSLPIDVTNLTLTGNVDDVTIPAGAVGVIIQLRNDATDLLIYNDDEDEYFTVKKQTTGTDTPPPLHIPFDNQRSGGKLLKVKGTGAQVVEFLWILN